MIHKQLFKDKPNFLNFNKFIKANPNNRYALSDFGAGDEQENRTSDKCFSIKLHEHTRTNNQKQYATSKHENSCFLMLVCVGVKKRISYFLQNVSNITTDIESVVFKFMQYNIKLHKLYLSYVVRYHNITFDIIISYYINIRYFMCFDIKLQRGVLVV